MREMLEPIFGATGAVVAQYVITLIVVLGLVGLVVWLVRRYAVGGISTNVRGRLPRLAIVDALVVDNRHRLVLIRRDNVEHLVLIGGATDLLIEPSIVRTRVPQRPAQPAPQARAAAAGTTPPAPPPAPPAPAMPAPPIRRAEEAAEAAIPFPPRGPRAAVAPRPGRVAPVRPPHRPAVPAVVALARASALKRPAAEAEPASAEEAEPAGAPPPHAAARLPESLFPAEPEVELPLGESPSTVPKVEAPPAAAEHPSAFAPPRHRPGAERAMPAADTAPAEDDGTTPPGPAPKVSDLEKEMARLLGEISSTRSS
jgi:flagellar biogenesis protein FliO